MIELYFTLTEPEYMEAQALFLKQAGRKRRWFRRALLGIVLSTVIVGALFSLASATAKLEVVLRQLLPAILLIVIFCTIPVLQKWTFKKRFRKEK